jgi:hypothetical protein
VLYVKIRSTLIACSGHTAGVPMVEQVRSTDSGNSVTDINISPLRTECIVCLSPQVQKSTYLIFSSTSSHILQLELVVIPRVYYWQWCSTTERNKRPTRSTTASMRAVLPGRPPAKLQSFSTALWEGLRVVVSKHPCDS